MAEIVGELLFVIVRAIFTDLAYAQFIKVGTWLDAKISGRTAKVAIGMLLGLALFFLIPIFAGLLGF